MYHVGDPAGTDGRLQENDATAAYHGVLRGDPAVARDTVHAIRAYQFRHGLLVAQRPLCTVARPRFLAADRARRLGSTAAVLAALFERAGRHMLASAALLERVGASEQERRLWEIDPGYGDFAVTSRLDSFFHGDDPMFIEYNAESPAGIGFCDELARMFSGLPAMSAWRWRDRGGWSSACGPLLDSLLRAFHEWGGSGTPRIAILDWDTVITRRDFELCAAHFWEIGVPTVIADPRAVEYRGGRAWVGDQPIDLVYRRVLLHELLEREGEIQPLLGAYRDGAVCIANSPRSKLLHKKTVFALLSDRSLGLPVSTEEADILERCIPWTRFLESGETEYHGDRVELTRLLLRQQDRFALKPADDYGGKGVVLGWDVTEAEWSAALEHGADRGYIVQERVDVPKEEYPTLQEDGLPLRDLIVDANPLLFHGVMGAVLTRLSGSALLNVTAGTGSAVPTFVLSEEA